MSKEIGSRVRYGEAFWRAHHEAWQQSALNQRQYCEAHGSPLKAFGNWRARFKAEPQPPVGKLLYRRHGLSHTPSHSVSQSLSHMTNGSSMSGPIVPPAREGYRRQFSEGDTGFHLRRSAIGAQNSKPNYIATVKLNNVEPFAWLRDVLQRKTDGHPASRLDELLPWNWQPITAKA